MRWSAIASRLSRRLPHPRAGWHGSAATRSPYTCCTNRYCWACYGFFFVANARCTRQMRRFTELFLALDATTGTRDKVDALVAYFASAPPDDAAWAAYFLTGGKVKGLAGTGATAAAPCDGTG